jgi:hypothetical protein
VEERGPISAREDVCFDRKSGSQARPALQEMAGLKTGHYMNCYAGVALTSTEFSLSVLPLVEETT